MLSVDNLKIRGGDFQLHDISFQVAQGEYLVLLGASGAGKTLLLESLAGLHPVDSGDITVDSKNCTTIHTSIRGLTLAFQDGLLFPHMNVRENIAFPLKAAGLSRQDQQNRIEQLTNDTGTTNLLNRKPATLSGGEIQRVALARALAASPDVLLLDEPLVSLDSHARTELRSVLRRIHDSGQTILHVTHDYDEALSLANRIAVLEHGTLTQIGTPDEIFQHPKSEFVARFAGIRNFFRGVLDFPQDDAPQQGRFIADKLECTILTDASPGAGCLILPSEEISLFNKKPEGSARNVFRGTIKEIIPARLGMEVIVDIDVDLAALVTASSVAQLELETGKEIWVTYKATAGRFIEA
ncbi:MAG: ABC transporter [Candidatus Hydrogenedentota bacterium]|nr:MAG: ABC transporter [Candidatus Hydrogenedentota bacterium]